MSSLHEWAADWGISHAALIDLRQRLSGDDLPSKPGVSEAAVQSQVRLEASRKGCRLFRNQVGAMYDATGGFVRFGLANDTHQMNLRIKSADLIGIRPVIITPAHVGTVIGQFLSRECKEGGWRYRGDKHEEAQMAWAQLITTLGGDAKFCNGEGSI